jgi:hypothetical protein
VSLDRPETPREATIRYRAAVGHVCDRYHRTAEKCRADAELAGKYAEAMAEVWRALDAGELYPACERVFGAKLLNRLEADWAKLDQLRARDLEWADAIDALTEWDLARARVEETAT